MRAWLLLAPLLLAGCTQPDEPAPGPRGPLPPSLLVDRTAQGTLQVYVHAKHGNVRYDFINVTLRSAPPGGTPADGLAEQSWQRPDAYALDLHLDVPAGLLAVEVVEGTATYAWAAHVALNETARPPALTVEVVEEHGQRAEPREHALPFEKLVPREEEA